MEIFDAHFHIDRGLDDYNIQATHRNVIFNFVKQYMEHSSSMLATDSITLIFDYKTNLDFVLQQINQKKISALKIHSRLQQIGVNDYENLTEAYKLVSDKNLPTIIDAFYIGDDIDFQPNLQKIVHFVKMFPKNTFIIAHSGGIKVLEYFLHLRTLPNVVFELSLSLEYLKYTSVLADFKQLLRYGDRNRIIFGTDFPYINASNHLETFLNLAEELKMNEADKHKILFENAKNLFHLIK